MKIQHLLQENLKRLGPDQNDPFEQGWRAAHRRQDDTECPYERGSKEHAEWMNGYEEGRAQPDHYNEDAKKKKPVVVKPKDEIGFKIADIGPGGREHNVKTDAAWDKKHGVKESVTDYEPKSQGGTRKELLAKLKSAKTAAEKSDLATRARKAGATQRELQDLSEGQYQGQYATRAEAIAYAKEKVKSFRDPEDGIEIWAMPSGRFDVVHNMNSHGRNDVIRNGGKKLGTIGKRYKGVTEKQLDELSVHKMLKYSDAAEKDRDALNQKWDNRTASEKEKDRVLRHEKGEQRAADKIKQKTGKLPVQIGKLDRLKHAITREGVAESSSAADDVAGTLNSYGYYTKNAQDYVHDKTGDRFQRAGSQWKHQSGTKGRGPEELDSFLSSKQDVSEGGKSPSPGWMLRQDPALAKKVKDATAGYKDLKKYAGKDIPKKDVSENNWTRDPWTEKYFGPTAGAIKKIFKITVQDDESNVRAFNVKAETEQQAREIIEKHAPGSTVMKIKFVKNLMAEQQLDEISSKLAGDYYSAATKKHVDKVGMRPKMYDRIEKDMGPQRKKGIDRAFDRITKDPLKEFAPDADRGDDGDDGFDEETLRKLAAKWFNGDEDPAIERLLMAAGWEIGQDEGYDDEPGVFVVMSGDEHGKTYISWPADELRSEVDEGKTGPGLWANIHAKQNRIKSGSGERMRKPGSKGAPKASDFKKAAAKNESSNYGDLDEAFNLEEEINKLDEKSAAWQRKEGKSKSGGLNKKGVASYRRANPGSKLQTAVTTKPSKLKPGSKPAKRRKSFCARMSGMKGPMKDEKGKPTRKALALRKWNC